jgi:hypothetical protein
VGLILMWGWCSGKFVNFWRAKNRTKKTKARRKQVSLQNLESPSASLPRIIRALSTHFSRENKKNTSF